MCRLTRLRWVRVIPVIVRVTVFSPIGIISIMGSCYVVVSVVIANLLAIGDFRLFKVLISI